MKKVFLNSLPKAGTNLVAKCLVLLGYKHVGTIDASLVKSGSLYSSIKQMYYRPRIRPGYIVGVDMPIELSKWSINRTLSRTKENEFLTGHIGYSDELLARIKDFAYSPILILRDPRAVLNSFVHYVSSNEKHLMHNYLKGKPLEEKYYLALYGYEDCKVSLKPLVERCKALNNWKFDPEILQLRFEDLVGLEGGGDYDSQESAIMSILTFLDIESQNIPEICENVFGPGRHTFRKGVISGWKDEMPLDVQFEVQNVLKDILTDWNYELI